eukprot:TRINITY_DN546_c0_g2_i1.p1 TRINITY_DN546_c0_g2~~TRINITY_DN546_c0_g2_i1.p1  ORF type:complete len:300 (+),score=71.13 TRINITY_DN546_c0_g2_i1:255-1154(+)
MAAPVSPGGQEIGFLGLGIMGLAMARNLIKAGFSVTVWNRTAAKCEELVAEGASQASSPAEVIKKCPITIAMLATPAAALDVAFGADGVAGAIGPGKSYVDMSTVDEATSTRISKAVEVAGGRFLEAPVSGSKGPAQAGQLVIMAAGDEALFGEVAQAFDVMGKKTFYLGPVGGAARMKLVVNMVMGSMLTAFAEGMALAERSDLSQQTLLDVLELGALSNLMFKMKGPAMINSAYPPAFPLKHQQKDMRLALALGDALDQPLPVAAAANEAFKRAKALGLGENDFAAVYAAISQTSNS